jgi:hypothetical protein
MLQRSRVDEVDQERLPPMFLDLVGIDSPTGDEKEIGDDGVIRTDGATILGADDTSRSAGCLELLTLPDAHPDGAGAGGGR